MSRYDVFAANIRQSGLGRWFFGREHNEQLIIAGLSALIVISALWTAVWKPVADWQAIEVNRAHNAQQLVDWLHVNEQAARQASRGQNNALQGSRALIPVITKAAVAHDLKLNRLQPESNGVISVVLQQQSFNQIVGWVSQLDENNEVSIERASFNGLDTPGYVNAQLRLH